jgi:hypothetical protein
VSKNKISNSKTWSESEYQIPQLHARQQFHYTAEKYILKQTIPIPGSKLQYLYKIYSKDYFDEFYSLPPEREITFQKEILRDDLAIQENEEEDVVEISFKIILLECTLDTSSKYDLTHEIIYVGKKGKTELSNKYDPITKTFEIEFKIPDFMLE